MGEEALYVRGVAGSRDERTDDRRRKQGAVVVQKGQRAHEIELPVGDPEHLGELVAGELAEREHAGRDAQALERTGDEALASARGFRRRRRLRPADRAFQLGLAGGEGERGRERQRHQADRPERAKDPGAKAHAAWSPRRRRTCACSWRTTRCSSPRKGATSRPGRACRSSSSINAISTPTISAFCRLVPPSSCLTSSSRSAFRSRVACSTRNSRTSLNISISVRCCETSDSFLSTSMQPKFSRCRTPVASSALETLVTRSPCLGSTRCRTCTTIGSSSTIRTVLGKFTMSMPTIFSPAAVRRSVVFRCLSGQQLTEI